MGYTRLVRRLVCFNWRGGCLMLSGLDFFIFIGSMAAVMGIGLLAGKGEETTSEDYFLAGRSIPWWGVAGSIFGTNISANHLVGMMGIGFSVGFAQTHFEIGAVIALLLLGYVFLPIFLELKIFTLSGYLEKRFGDTAGLLYALMSFILILVQMTAAYYIGSRTLNTLLSADLGYIGGILLLIGISCTYTIFGGLKAVVWTDVFQSSVLLIAGILVAVLTFNHPEIGGWSDFMARDAAQATPKMNLYLPTDHPQLPWSGVFTGLFVMHIFYWGNNQYLVQRALAAKSLAHARYGMFAGGLMKLLVPFFSIAGGIAAAQLFTAIGKPNIAPDDAFPELVKLVVPLGYGIVGIIAAGLLGAIVSSIDSMMNSAATIATIDIYKKYVNPDVSEKEMVWIGRGCIITIVLISATLAVLTYDPTGKSNFFLIVSSQSSYFTPGIVAAFLLGIFSKKITHRGAVVAILISPIFSYIFEFFYVNSLNEVAFVNDIFGDNINFMHRAFFAFLISFVSAILVSKNGKAHGEYTWHKMVANPESLGLAFKKLWIICASLCVLALVAYFDVLPRWILGTAATLGIFYAFISHIKKFPREGLIFMKDDRVYAGLLAGLSVLILFLF